MRHFSAKHPQISTNKDPYERKTISFRYQTATGKWKQAINHPCCNYYETSESIPSARVYANGDEKMFLVQVYSRRYQNEGLSTYVGFRNRLLMHAYLKKEGLL